MYPSQQPNQQQHHLQVKIPQFCNYEADSDKLTKKTTKAEQVSQMHHRTGINFNSKGVNTGDFQGPLVVPVYPEKPMSTDRHSNPNHSTRLHQWPAEDAVIGVSIGT